MKKKRQSRMKGRFIVCPACDGKKIVSREVDPLIHGGSGRGFMIGRCQLCLGGNGKVDLETYHAFMLGVDPNEKETGDGSMPGV